MNRRLISFIIISVVSILAGVFEVAQAATSQKDCTEVGLGAPLGPNRRQGDIGWCYANAAADLITYRFQKELKGARASAGYIALAYSHDYFDGGLSSLAIVRAQTTGFCPMSVEENVLSRGPKEGIKEKLAGLAELKKRFDATHGESLASDLHAQYASTNSVLTAIPRADLIEIFTNSTSSTIAKNLADYLCRGKMIYPEHFALVVPESKYVFGGATSPLMKTIHEQLSSPHNNILSVSYFAGFFNTDGSANNEDDRHVSVVIGRRWHLNRCELQIRNSWGERCDTYTANSLKDKDMCSKGNIWVPENILEHAIFGLAYIAK